MPRDHTSAHPSANPSPESALAAIDRAERHHTRDVPGVPIWEITEHLAIPRRSRRIRDVLDALEGAGVLQRSLRHGVRLWVLTSAGRRRLQRIRRAGKLPGLPESPQHRRWREARCRAEREIGSLHHNLCAVLREARSLLTVEPPPHSDSWFDLAERLHRCTWQLGSATHCAYEWAEPTDRHADIDNHQEPGDQELSGQERARRRSLRSSRRNLSRWWLP